jgi:twinkle protein
MIKITQEPDTLFVDIDQLEREILTLPFNKEVTCPNCSDRRKYNPKKPVFRKFKNAECIGFTCAHCHIQGLIDEDSDKPNPPMYVAPVFKSGLHRDIVTWLQSRGLSEETAIDFKLSWREDKYGTPIIAFNYYNRDGKMVGTKYRYTKKKRYYKEKGSKSILYGFQQKALQGPEKPSKLIMVEGELDAMSIAESKSGAVLSLPDGASENKQGDKLEKPFREAADWLSDIECFVWAGDTDSAGTQAMDEWTKRLGVERCKVVKWPEGCKDANDTLVRFGKAKVRECVENAKFIPIDGIKDLGDEWPLMIELYEKGLPEIEGLGFSPKFDSAMKFIPGQFTLITGVPNHGKTHFALFLMMHLSVKYGWKWGIFSPEQDAPDWLGGRKLPRHLFINKALTEFLVGMPLFSSSNFVYPMGGATVIDRMPLASLKLAGEFIDQHFKIVDLDVKRSDLKNVMKMAKTLHLREGIQGFLIDPWNKMRGVLGYDNQALADRLVEITSFVKALGIHMLINVHPHKLTYEMKKDLDGNTVPVVGRPSAYNIKGGGEFYDMAWNILSVYRDFLEEETVISTQKVKHSMLGRPGVNIRYHFNPANGRYYEVGTNPDFMPLGDLESLALKMPW